MHFASLFQDDAINCFSTSIRVQIELLHPEFKFRELIQRRERILLYTLCLATMLEVLFEILVYAKYTSLLRFTFTPRLYLRCNLIKIGCWTISGIVTVIDDYLYDSSGHYLSYKGYSTAFAIVSMYVII
jgi:hypothetical protein